MKQMRLLALFAAGLLVGGGVTLLACPATGVVCAPFLHACGSTCADIQNDSNNCGGCGIACQPSQACVPDAGQNHAPGCVCVPGSVPCGGQCVVTSSDPNNCGNCAGMPGGVVCSPGEVCELSACKVACTLSGSNNCDGGCKDLSSDPLNCGGCGIACQSQESCHDGACRFDLLFACSSVGAAGVKGVSATSLLAGPLASLGTSPQALATSNSTLLSSDGTDANLYEADLGTLEQYTEAPFAAPPVSDVLVDGANVFIANTDAGTLQVLQAGGTATHVPAPLDGGLGLGTVAVRTITDGGSPKYMTKVGNSLYVSLYASGQVAQVDVTNPASPVLVNTFNLNQLNLNTFLGAPVASGPWGICAFGGKVYVALKNNYFNSGLGALVAAGDGGLIAIINPADGGLSEWDVGSDVCLQPTWLLPSLDGTRLFVSCAGQAEVGTSMGRAVVALNTSGQRVAVWNCANVGGDAGCGTFAPNVFAQRGTRLYVGDSLGRALVLETQDGGLSEVAGFGPGSAPLNVCPLNGNISYVISVP
jgi:hypothetical protein